MGRAQRREKSTRKSTISTPLMTKKLSITKNWQSERTKQENKGKKKTAKRLQVSSRSASVCGQKIPPMLLSCKTCNDSSERKPLPIALKLPHRLHNALNANSKCEKLMMHQQLQPKKARR